MFHATLAYYGLTKNL
jgi:hypothetical protein